MHQERLIRATSLEFLDDTATVMPSSDTAENDDAISAVL
jgi:GntR family transcriptional repressor for pyruvate dehydrogenase complex